MAQEGLKIEELLEACGAQLRSREALSELTVLEENRGDIKTAVKTALGKLGVVAVVGSVVAENRRPNVSEPVWLPVNFVVAVYENVAVNRSRAGHLTAQVATERCADALHHFRPGAWGPVTCRRIEPVEDGPINRYELECQIGE